MTQPRQGAAPLSLAASAPVVILATQATQAVASRVFTVQAASSAGDTLLVMLIINQNGSAVTGVTDSKGNVYTKLNQFTTNTPNGWAFYCPGATGGSGGGDTAALTTSDTITVTMSASSMLCNIYVVKITGAGPIDQMAYQGVQGNTVSTLSV